MRPTLQLSLLSFGALFLGSCFTSTPSGQVDSETLEPSLSTQPLEEEKHDQQLKNKAPIASDSSIPANLSNEFTSGPGNTTLENHTFFKNAKGEKITLTRTLYRRDKSGNLRSGSVYDDQNKKLFRVLFGYHQDNGRLIAENIYDARVRRTNPKNPSKEEPIRAARYLYSSLGERRDPLIFTSQAAQTSEELMGWLDRNKPASDVDRDPFRKVPVTLNGKPLDR